MNAKLTLKLGLVSIITIGVIFISSSLVAAKDYIATSPNFKVAFIGDARADGEVGGNANALAVLNLINAEGAEAVIHAGDLDGSITPDPDEFNQQINNILGADFPYFIVPGNHDVFDNHWPDYQQHFLNRLALIDGIEDIEYSGDMGVQSYVIYKGLFILLLGANLAGSGHADYIDEQLTGNNYLWRTSTWHTCMHDMQTGSKGDEAGWDLYQAAMRGGAIITTGHEHSYTRTMVMNDIGNRENNHGFIGDPNQLEIREGRTFVAVSGLGGQSKRDYDSTIPANPWWSTIYTEDFYLRDKVIVSTEAGAFNYNYGALFITFNVDGDPRKARGEFKNIDGEVIDSFEIISMMGDTSNYILTINADNGIVIKDPDQATYDFGAEVGLTAIANDGFKFNGWEGGGLSGTDNTVTITMDSDKSIIANFIPLDPLTDVAINQAWLDNQDNVLYPDGTDGPYILTDAGATHILYTDVTVPETAFVIGAANITFDLKGHTITYGDAPPVEVTNGGFETGSGASVPGWNLSGALDAAIAPNERYLWGDQVLRFNQIITEQSIISDVIQIPKANREYKAAVTSKGRWDYGTVTISVIDAASGTVLASNTTDQLGSSYSAVADFVPEDTNDIRLKITIVPNTTDANGNPITPTIDIDYADFAFSRDYGIVATRSYYYLPDHLQTDAIIDACINHLPNFTTIPNFTLKNGRIFQGQARSYDGSPLYFVSLPGGFSVDGVEAFANGVDTRVLNAQYANWAEVRNSTFRADIDNITFRQVIRAMLSFGEISGPVTIEDNHIIDAPHQSIYLTYSPPEQPCIIRNNLIEPNTIVTDAYGIGIDGMQNFEVSNNTILAGPGKSSRGIIIDNCVRDDQQNHVPSIDGEIFGNYVDIRERPNREYGIDFEATALRLRCYETGDLDHRNIHIYDNTFIARAGDGDNRAAMGARIGYMQNDPLIDLNNVIEDNVFKAIVETGNAYYFARAMSFQSMGSDTSPLVRNNVLESNHISLGLGDNNGASVADALVISNTLRKSNEGDQQRTYETVRSGYWRGYVHDVQLIDMQYQEYQGDGTLTEPVPWNGEIEMAVEGGGSGGTENLAVGWFLNVQVQDDEGTPLGGAVVEVFDRENIPPVFTGTTDATGRIDDITVIEKVYSQAPWDYENPPSSLVVNIDPRGPHRLEVSHLSYEPYIEGIDLVQSMSKTVTLGGTPSINYGDVNDDNDITIADAILVAQHWAGAITLTANQLTVADVDGVGGVTIKDAILIAQKANGIITTFPVE